jgi:redox-sensitive bicupin YhaK (pirin superfamily)
LEPGHTLDYTVQTGRCVFIYDVSGELNVNGGQLGKNDQARVTGEEHLPFSTQTRAEFIMIDSADIG